MSSTENNSFENKKELVSKKIIWKPAPDNEGPLRVRFQESNEKLVD